MEPLAVAANAHLGLKKVAEGGFREQRFTRPVGEDAPSAHEQDAAHLGQNVSEQMGDHDESGSLGSERAECVAQVALRGHVQRVRGFVEQELAGPVDKRAGDEDAALFAGGHLADQARRQMGRLDAFEGFAGALAHQVCDVEIGPEGGGGKESREDGIEAGRARSGAAGGVGGAGVSLVAGNVIGDDAEVAAKLGYVPASATKDAQLHARLNQRINLAVEGADEGGFAAAIGAENGDVFARFNVEVNVAEDDGVAQGNVDIAHSEEGFARGDFFGGSTLGRHFVRVNGMSDISSLVIPAGFRFAATTAGLKASGRPDFAVMVADKPASAAALFTANRVSAAPLTVDKEHLKQTGGWVRVVAINAGNANCAVGQAGIDAAQRTCEAAAERFGCKTEEVFPSSTGIIGVPLPVEKLVAALPAIEAALGSESEHFQQVAQAILTTDLVEKTAFARLLVDGVEVRIAGVCKGSGMIHPQLVPHATMLGYVLTDAVIDPPVLQGMLGAAVNRSFNRISVDGDTSTNDTVLMLASGASGARVEAGEEAFQAALDQVAISLARQIVSDGEGVTHVVELRIEGAASDEDALRVARAIAHSPLVKTAWAGSDPNWGRLMAAIGYSGAAVDAERIDIDFGELAICRNGGRASDLDLAAAHRYLKEPEFSVTVQLHQGAGKCVFWTTDLTAEYVSINADYST